MSAQKIAVVGTGAQGAGIGADLIRAGLDVTFIEQWPAHVEAMRQRGIEVRMPSETVITPVPRVFHLCEVATLREQFDVVFLLVKAYDTRWACELIKPLVAPNGLVVGLQNGMSIDDIASIMGPERTIGAVIEMASNMFEPGIVNRQNPPSQAWFAVGAFDGSQTDRAVEVQQLLQHAGTVAVSTDIRSSKWMKLIANAGELVTSAILDLPLEEAMLLPGVLDMMIECCKEAARVAVANGATLVPIFGMSETDVTTPDQYAEDLLSMVRSHFSLPDTKTTVLQDWMKGRHSEVDEINGLVVELARSSGSSAPVNERTVRLAHMIEAGTLAAHPSNVDLLLGTRAL